MRKFFSSNSAKSGTVDTVTSYKWVTEEGETRHHSEVFLTCPYKECKVTSESSKWEGDFAQNDSSDRRGTALLKVACCAEHLEKWLKKDNSGHWTNLNTTLSDINWADYQYSSKPNDTTEIYRHIGTRGTAVPREFGRAIQSDRFATQELASPNAESSASARDEQETSSVGVDLSSDPAANMKFGKTIQSQQVPGWGEYYLNYKALKKIINSLAAGRPASDASLLSLGLRPAKRPLALSSDSAAYSSDPTIAIMDLEPLPPETEPPAPGNGSRMSRSRRGSRDREDSFIAHRDVFFFTLQRELEKINAFYLIKERDLRLRLLTLLTNRKRLLQHISQSSAEPGRGDEDGGARKGVEWSSLEEGWRLFERDLGKLQGFIEINATGFRKILKKWDKRSKSNTKELYIERQVEVQPCFNREFIAKLSDIVAANLLDLENGSEHLSTSFLVSDLPETFNVEGSAFDFEVDLAQDVLVDLEANLVKACQSGRDAIIDWLKLAKARQHREKDKRLMRILWRAALYVPADCVDLVLGSIHLDFEYIDDINNRSPLHPSCTAGSLRLVQLCLEKNTSLLELPDAYQRRPLHYAAMHGHASIVSYLLSQKADPSATDMDGYTPLMHAITQGHFEVVRIFVNENISLEPTAISNDLIPLSLACQAGHVEVARLLLQRGATVLPNSEGLYPQHFAAKAGHEAICKLLVEEGGKDGGGKDRQDKYNLWTPLHHAAVGGEPRHLKCIEILVDAGCDVNALDEYGKSPGWYAAWFGNVQCLTFLLDHGAKLSERANDLKGMGIENLGLSADPQMEALSPGSDLELGPPNEDFELIPSLSLPPPYMPPKEYGHQFLSNRCLVQLSLGHPFSRPERGNKVQPVKLYSRFGQDPLHLWSSLKLVMTSKSDITAVPHSVILPLADEREVFTFHVENLERFTLELSLYPTFGSKVIGRAIVLPSTFLDIKHHKGFSAPLLDHHLKAIGEVSFEVSCIKPFQGAQLEIGGRVETYWKSRITPAGISQDHAHLHAHRPSTSPPTSVSASVSALVTASSLSGDYINLVVQVTKDGTPVCFSDWRLPIPGLDIGVSDVTFQQFTYISSSSSLALSPQSAIHSPREWYDLIARSMVSLDDVLAIIPQELGINFNLRYTRDFDKKQQSVSRVLELNTFVDSVLHSVYHAGKTTMASASGRNIVFSSLDPTVCTALKWKQPNFPVFFTSFCGIARTKQPHSLVPASPEEESDMRCLSVREAVNFAKSTSLLGVILEATTLAAVPSLVASVKDAGLLLAVFGDEAEVSAVQSSSVEGRKIDAVVIDGVITVAET
ncbi:CDK inhibitor PHO81, partial [Tremellales sp. Uapishka_1]